MFRKLLLVRCCILLLSVKLLNSQNESRKVSQTQCFCELQGQVDECCCDVETTDEVNSQHIRPLLERLLRYNYFRFFRVNLKKECPFWPDDSRCMLKDCHVDSCSEDELPSGLKNDIPTAMCSPEETQELELSKVDESLTVDEREKFETWKEYDDEKMNFCELDNETSESSQYVDLLKNPERYTGYAGTSANRIWKAIYEENCFRHSKAKNVFNRKSIADLCREKRVFYRAISGMHASINIHLCANYYFAGNLLKKARWHHNTAEFQRRFDAATTSGEGPGWLKNLYTLYLLMLRAVVKAAPYLEKESFYTGVKDEDLAVKQLILQLIESAKFCPRTFNESDMFKGQSAALKEEFRLHFWNISRIMDCVGCDKCRLWGKLQTLGIGTALKILFSWELSSSKELGQSKHFHLRRTELVALFNALGRYSTSIYELQTFRHLEEKVQTNDEL